MTAVNLDGSLCPAQLGRDLLVEEASDDEDEHFALPWRQRFKPLSQARELLGLVPGLFFSPDALPDGIEQRMIGKRLLKKFQRSTLHGTDGHRNVPPASNEDNGKINPELSYPLLQFETRQIGQVHIEDEAIGVLQSL